MNLIEIIDRRPLEQFKTSLSIPWFFLKDLVINSILTNAQIK